MNNLFIKISKSLIKRRIIINQIPMLGYQGILILKLIKVRALTASNHSVLSRIRTNTSIIDLRASIMIVIIRLFSSKINQMINPQSLNQFLMIVYDRALRRDILPMKR